MRYVSNTEKEKQAMLQEIGVSSVMDLFKDIDSTILIKDLLPVSSALSEMEVRTKVEELSKKNSLMKSFIGAGFYYHYSPSVVNHILLRSEFYTAYTPYQPEMSQGALQSIFEFQTFICTLTGMDVANASMYDGTSALAEAAFMSHMITRRKKIVVARSVHPEYQKAIRTYCITKGLEYVEVGYDDGRVDLSKLKELVDDDTASVIVQNPNFFGSLENLQELADVAAAKGALFVVSVVEATSLGIVKEPGMADIVTGEGQALGIPVSFGGPSFGFLAVNKKHLRKLPGRLVGETEDVDGNKGYIMTLQAREQHIRREKATSNICTNQALLALGGTVYMAMMGKKLKDLAYLNVQKAHYAASAINELDGFEVVFNGAKYNEFVVKCKDGPSVLAQLQKNDMLAGIDLGKFYDELKDHLLICTTEMHSKQDIDQLVGELQKCA